MATTVTGAVVERLLGDATFTSLVPDGVWVGDEPEEKRLPLAVLKEMGPRIQAKSSESNVETYRLALRVSAAGATTAGQPSPAEQIADRVEALLNRRHGDLSLSGMSPVSLTTKRWLEKEPRVRVDDKRVYRATVEIVATVERMVVEP